MSKFVRRKVKEIKQKRSYQIFWESKDLGNKLGNSFLFSHPPYVPTSPTNRASWLYFFLTPKLESKHNKREREGNFAYILREHREAFGEELEEEAG